MSPNRGSNISVFCWERSSAWKPNPLAFDPFQTQVAWYISEWSHDIIFFRIFRWTISTADRLLVFKCLLITIFLTFHWCNLCSHTFFFCFINIFYTIGRPHITWIHYKITTHRALYSMIFEIFNPYVVHFLWLELSAMHNDPLLLSYIRSKIAFLVF